MKELKAIDPVSLGKMLAIIWAVFGFIAGLFAAAGISAIPFGMPFLPLAVGLLAIIIVPIVAAIVGFIMGVIVAFVYNIIAKRFGGVMLDL